jgi:hypothetical protein
LGIYNVQRKGLTYILNPDRLQTRKIFQGLAHSPPPPGMAFVDGPAIVSTVQNIVAIHYFSFVFPSTNNVVEEGREWEIY